MNALFSLPTDIEITAPPQRGLYLVTTRTREAGKVTRLIASLALRGPLQIVAGSEWIPGYDVARLLRHQVTQIEPVLGRIQLRRAFTCYQLLDLLGSIRPESAPVLVLDMLHTFLNNDIHLDVRRRVLERCLGHLQRLSLSRPVAVLAPQVAAEDYPRFYAMLSALADEIYQARFPEPAATQPGLF